RAPASSTGRKRPARTPGLKASSAGFLVPDAIRKKFSGPRGWDSHVPLNFLTDKFCAFANTAAAKELNDIFLVDSTSGAVVSTARELSVDSELALSFDEWFQAWGRLLELIQTYVPEEHELWVVHFNSILHRPNRAQRWPLCLEYDSTVRRRALNTSLDPAVFQDEIWDELEPTHIAKRAVVILRNEHKKASSNSGRYQPYKGAKQFTREGNDSFRPKQKFRCFVCASNEDFHKSRNCTADRLTNGKPTLLSPKTRQDKNGNSYCFSFNGFSGCPGGGPDCQKGHHWCSICGDKSGRHSAQDCTSV
ncbi:hypothetical protein B0H16DRAFT_1245203, partial [Mycena metata]